MSSSIIRTEGLSKSYETGGEEVFAVRDLDLEIEEGEFTVLMGSSGSGKSTLLYVLSGLEQRSTGKIHFADRRIDTLNETELSLLRRTGIGFVFQAINLVPHLTLLENVVVPGYLVERKRAGCRRRCRAASSSARRSRAR